MSCPILNEMASTVLFFCSFHHTTRHIFSQQMSGGHEESKTNEEGSQDGGQAVPEIWDYIEHDNK